LYCAGVFGNYEVLLACEYCSGGEGVLDAVCECASAEVFEDGAVVVEFDEFEVFVAGCRVR